MKFQHTFLIGIMSMMGLTSCLSEAFDGAESAKDQGTLEVSVDLQQPAARAVSEVTDFPVTIFDANGKELYSYQTVTAVPKSITLQVGNYTVESHTPGAIRKEMATPYYIGSKDVEILKNVTSPVDVICKMANSQINVSYTSDFKSTFTSWDITISDGSETALSFLNTTTNNSVYWWFGENGAKELTVNFRGTTTTGNTVAGRFILTKDNADSVYDDDTDYFCGGEIINLTFDPTDATDGVVSSVTISADVSFVETNETITIGVVDVPTFVDPDPTPGPGGDDNNISLTLPAPITLASADAMFADPSTGDVVISAEAGIKSITVKVNSSSDDMMEQLGEVANQYDGVDLVGGCEVVGNQNLVAFLASLQKTIVVPAVGDKNYTFPVGQFYGFLGLLPGEHNFTLTVTDMDGNKKSGNVKVTITM